MEEKDLRERVLKRWTRLKIEREPYVAQWLEISRHITPASGRFLDLKSRDNEARDRWNRIYDSTAVRAANILQAGLMSGMTDPSTQWFSLTTGSPSLDESHAVKVWLDEVQRIMEMVFTQTNVYQALQHCWREVGVYGVSAFVVVEDPVYAFVAHPLVCGEYCIACDFRGRPDTLYRKFTMTAGQMVSRSGRSRVSKAVLQHYDNGQFDEPYECIHAIEPRFDRDPTKLDNKQMPWRSVVIQVERESDDPGILEESGYKDFPAIIGRWGASASDVYSEESPGMMAIGDTLQLGHHQKQKGNAIDYMVNPPLIMPADARDNDVDFLPGGRSYIDNPGAGSQVQPAFAVNLPLGDLREDIADVRNRINQAFNVDLFLMIANSGRGQMTATEVAERHEEKLMMLGPVLSRLNEEVLRPLIERCFAILSRQGKLPPPPEELRGQTLSVEYTSMLARSQRAIRANSLDQFVSRVAQASQFNPNILQKVDVFQLVDEYADYFSVAPSVVVPTDEARAIIEQQQQALQQQQQAEQMQQSAEALAKLGKVPADQSTLAGKAVQGMGEALQAQ